MTQPTKCGFKSCLKTRKMFILLTWVVSFNQCFEEYLCLFFSCFHFSFHACFELKIPQLPRYYLKFIRINGQVQHDVFYNNKLRNKPCILQTTLRFIRLSKDFFSYCLTYDDVLSKFFTNNIEILQNIKHF